jgi:hypothetical protein
MPHTGPVWPSPFPPKAVASELGQLRQRGFLNLDYPEGAQRRLSLPFLEMLAIMYLGAAAPSGRSAMLQKYLDIALLKFADASNAQVAIIIRWLLFGPEDQPLGVYSQGALLAMARKKYNLTKDEFHHRQQGWFLQFAEFLIDLQQELPSNQDPPAEPPQDPSQQISEAC